MRVVVGMSGGVDSSVAAALLREAGHDVVGVTLDLFAGRGRPCCGAGPDALDAREVCARLGIKHRLVDRREIFERAVVEPFVLEYCRLRTPNPCVECNRRVKFSSLLEAAERWGAQAVATGHYARVSAGEGGSFRLLCGTDARKDQSYFLYSLCARELSRTLFPLGELTKEEVRRRARALGLPTAEKPQSQEVCFVPRGGYASFVRARSQASSAAFAPGDVRGLDGRLLGRHAGLARFTVGQRRGLGALGPEPLYAARLDGPSNTLFVGRRAEIERRAFEIGGVHWIRGEPALPRALVRVRYRGRRMPAGWTHAGAGRLRVEMEEGADAIAPGQAAVFYLGDEVIGGGTIEEAL
jgi:tRNA-specific 2-thiouridylase